MTSATALDQFLTQPSEPDEDDQLPQADLTGHLASIAESLRTIAEVFTTIEHGAVLEGQDQAADAEAAEADLRTAYNDLLTRLEARDRLLDEVLAIVKPSTSKLADKVRAALTPAPAEQPAEGPTPEPGRLVSERGPELVHGPEISGAEGPTPPPAHDADVEEWRGYAQSRGYAGSDIDRMNRSQIRTMLGIPQPGETLVSS